MKKNVMKNLDTIKEKRTISDEKKKMISNKLISNFVIGISFIVLVLIFYVVKSFVDKTTAEMIYHISSMAFIIVTIVTFEIAYKKKKGELGLNGVELLFISIYALFAPYVYYKYNKIAMAFTGIVALYYSIKSIAIYNKEKAKIEREHDDIGTIIKKESQDELVKEYKEKKESIKEEPKKQEEIDEDEDDYDELLEDEEENEEEVYNEINEIDSDDVVDEEIVDIKPIEEEPEEIIKLVEEQPKEKVREKKEKTPAKSKTPRKKKTSGSTIIPKEFVGTSNVENPLVEDSPKFESENNVEVKPSSKPEIIIVTTKSKPTRAQQTHVKKTTTSTTKKTTTKKSTTTKTTTAKKGTTTRKTRTSKSKADK